ncbi:MAG: gliding motility-associated C-terminal domain-containing protein [Flavobacteriaceae bacterium]|nr:gliding motility-associated C-terminal domain-containing protein [Flavobacteriaceae bacterium]
MKRANPLSILCLCFMFFMVRIGIAQELAQPTLGFSYACASENFNEFNVEVSSVVGGFNSDNVFVVEISDGKGSFENAVVLRQVSDKNFTLNFSTSFALPSSTFGENHMIRVRATSPAMTSPLSEKFAAYFISNTPLVLENYQDIYLCEGTSTNITIENTQFTSFNWYLDGAYYATAGPSISIKKEGLYYASVDFGICSGGLAVSNLIRVTTIAPILPEISGADSIPLCSGESYELLSSITSIENNYYWYKDGSLILGLPVKSSSLTVSGDNMYGSYSLEIETAIGCVSHSESVEITNANTDFEVTALGPLDNIIVFNGNPHKLEISMIASATAINWYKDDVLFLENGAASIQVTDEGQYKALVSIPGDPCGAEVSSPIFKVYNPSKYFVSIGLPTNYTSCSFSKTTIRIKSLEYGISSGQKFKFNDFDASLFSYRWMYSGEEVAGGNTSSLLVDDVVKVGAYKLVISDANGVKAVSNAVKVNLKLSSVQIKGPEVVHLCANDSYTFEAAIDDANFTYIWFKNEVEIGGIPSYTPSYTVSNDVHGDYRVEVRTNGGCTTVSNTISLLSAAVSFNVIANDATLPIILYSGLTETLTISTTAVYPSITWYKDGYEIPGSNSLSLSISSPGEYRAKVEVIGACGQTVYSDYFSVISPQNYEVSIKTGVNYTSCDVSQTLLSLKELRIRIATDKTILISALDYDKFTFQWWHNGVLIPGETASSILVNDWKKSGTYTLQVTAIDAVTFMSIGLDIELELPMADIKSENVGDVICKGTTVVLSTTVREGCTYQWYLDGSPLTGENSNVLEVLEEGAYFVAVLKNSCQSTSDLLEIDFKDEDSIQISPEGVIFITQGETKNITASGASTYEWQNENGEVLSTTDVLSVYEPGIYAVIAQVGDCEFVKIVEVAYKTSTTIPNIISPNDDGINDTWVLPYGYSFNDQVEIIIYNANGIIVFRTTNYQNNWPESNVVGNSIFYYIIKEKGQVVAKGSITIIK